MTDPDGYSTFSFLHFVVRAEVVGVDVVEVAGHLVLQLLLHQQHLHAAVEELGAETVLPVKNDGTFYIFYSEEKHVKIFFNLGAIQITSKHFGFFNIPEVLKTPISKIIYMNGHYHM